MKKYHITKYRNHICIVVSKILKYWIPPEYNIKVAIFSIFKVIPLFLNNNNNN